MKSLPLIALFALTACEPVTNQAPDVGIEGDLTLDKELASADEIAAIVATRAVMDAMVDRRLMTPRPNIEDAPGIGAQCAEGPPTVVWRETGCAGLEGWGLETTWTDCEIPGVGRVGGALFVSFADVLANLPLETDADDAELQLYAMTEGRGPDLVSRYHVSLQGDAGGNIEACGTTSGPRDNHYIREVIDVDIDGHEARIVWDAATSRIGGEVDAFDLSYAAAQAQFPRGALVDPYRFEVTDFERDLRSAVAYDGILRQHGWQGDVVGYIDPNTAQLGDMHVERPDGREDAKLPRF